MPLCVNRNRLGIWMPESGFIINSGRLKARCHRRNVRQWCVGTIVLFLAVLLGGCVNQHNRDQAHHDCESDGFALVQDLSDASTQLASGDAGRGEVLFTSLCSGCHVHGRLSTVAQAVANASSSSDAPVPPHLACERFQRSYSKAYLAATIKHGGRPEFKVHSMPAWEGVLNDEDIADLIAYIVTAAGTMPNTDSRQ